MKSAVSFFLNNGDIVLVNRIPVNFEKELKTFEQKKNIVKIAKQLAKKFLVREYGFSGWNVEKLMNKCKIGICSAYDDLDDYERFSHDDLVNYFQTT